MGKLDDVIQIHGYHFFNREVETQLPPLCAVYTSPGNPYRRIVRKKLLDRQQSFWYKLE